LEGDSQIIIQLITKILHGEHPSKISPNWRLSGLLEEFGALLKPNISIIPSHVKKDEHSSRLLNKWRCNNIEGKHLLGSSHLISYRTLDSMSTPCQQRLPNPGWGSTSYRDDTWYNAWSGLKYKPPAPIPSPLRMEARRISQANEPRPLMGVKGKES